MSRTLSGLFLVGALNRPRKRKRTNRENPRTIPEQIGKIPEKSGKSQKGQKRTKKEGQVQIGKPPRLKHPRLAALDLAGVPASVIATRKYEGVSLRDKLRTDIKGARSQGPLGSSYWKMMRSRYEEEKKNVGVEGAVYRDAGQPCLVCSS